jgi:MoaA/NifB/PqqE/SkfB family radical SAM enzyme
MPVHVIRLMKRCNSACEFCSVEGEMAEARKKPDVPLESVQRQILSQPAGATIDFFGGEPTLYPRIVEAVRFARERGYRPTMASNARRFCDPAFTEALAGAGLALVHSTLLGHTEALHNELSVGGKTSFAETMLGFKNMLAAKIPLQVNIVILRQNHEFLADMTRLLAAAGVRDVKFGSLTGVGAYAHLAARLSDVRPRLAEAVEVARAAGARFCIEKTPICALPEAAGHFQPETDPLTDQRLDTSAGECARCLVRDRCYGVDPGYARLFGTSELRAVRSRAQAARRWPPVRR